MIYKKGESARFALTVLSPLEDFLECLDGLESSIHAKKNQIIKDAEKIRKEDKEEYWDWNIDDYVSYNEDFPLILRTSFFISMYSYFENQFLNQCSDSDKLSKIKGSGIEKGKKYFKEVYNVITPFQLHIWSFIQDCNKIRNVLVHNGGNIDRMINKRKQVEIRKVIEKIDGVIITEYGDIFLEKSFCESFHKAIHEFLIILFQSKNTNK